MIKKWRDSSRKGMSWKIVNSADPVRSALAFFQDGHERSRVNYWANHIPDDNQDSMNGRSYLTKRILNILMNDNWDNKIFQRISCGLGQLVL